MTGEWPMVSVSQVAIPVLGGTPSRKIPDYWGGSIKWASAKDVTSAGNRYIYNTEEAITEKGLHNSAAKILPKGTVVITARGTVGVLVQLGCDMSFNQTCYGLIPKNEVLQDYLYYALRGSLSTMRSLTYGTVFETITMKTFDQWQIPLPSILEQQAIACILGALDDKIELNRRMNRTLEEMARALFKSWFVDFEPVRCKAAGQPPPGLAPDIAALFPDSFEDSELGEIPKGWNITTLGKICELAYGKGLKTSERRPGKVPVMGSNGQVGWHDEALVRGPGIIVGRKGNPGIVTWIQSDFFPIDTTFYVNTKIDHVPLTYLFFALKYLNLQNLGADSAVPGLNRNIAYMSKLLLPFPYILDNFNKITFVLFEKIYKSDQLNIDLINLRDALLPKLISGELRVPDAERIVGRCT